MPPKGKRAAGSSRGSPAWDRAEADKATRSPGGEAHEPPRAPEPFAWPLHNLETDPELVALRAERARLVQQCEAAGLDATTPDVAPRRALHARHVVLPTLDTPCPACAAHRRDLRKAEAALARIDAKYRSIQQRYTAVLRTQARYQNKIRSLHASLNMARDRLIRAGLSPVGPAPEPDGED